MHHVHHLTDYITLYDIKLHYYFNALYVIISVVCSLLCAFKVYGWEPQPFENGTDAEAVATKHLEGRMDDNYVGVSCVGEVGVYCLRTNVHTYILGRFTIAYGKKIIFHLLLG